MSMRYKGAVISATPPTLATDAGASGAWTLEQQMQAKAAGVWPKNGPFNWIEDSFSTYLYTGNTSTQTITNGIDLAGKGGMVWIKNRTGGPYNHMVFDSTRLPSQYLHTNTTDANQTNIYQLTSFNSNGFTLGDGNLTNNSAATYASWTFRKQPKFFDVVTYTGNGVAGRTVAHNLGSIPGCIMVKRTDASASWSVYHRSLANTQYLTLNTTDDASTDTTTWNSTTATSTVFSLGTDTRVNASGGTYVAYVFGHNAGGFGLSGADNVVSCGAFTTDGSGNATVNLGYEPQWMLVKQTNGFDNWYLIDTMRGFVNPGNANGSDDARLYANTSGAENAAAQIGWPTATGFFFNIGTASANYIYIAIRRGPMKVPTDGTKVFNTNLETNGTNPNTLTTGFPVDLNINTVSSSNSSKNVLDRLRGFSTTDSIRLQTNTTGGEATLAGGFSFANNTGVIDLGWQNQAGGTFWSFARAPSFFDEVCYTGNSTAGATQPHNLGAIPELILVVSRTVGVNWNVYSAALSNTEYLSLNTTDAKATGTNRWNSTSPTTSVFSLGTNATVNGSGEKYVAYLFASAPGVSKVGSYTGNGSSQTIPCGFTGGSRFVMIKRTDSAGDWYIWDSARGIVAGNDPHLSLNSSAAQVTTDDSVDTDSTGFVVNQVAATNVNVNAATYLFLAIA